MAKFTIATAKKALAAAYPHIEFTYGRAGRGREAGPCVSWVGGPLPAEIRTAAGAPAGHYYGHAPYHFIRQNTPEEWEEQHRKWDEEHRARVAAEPARRAAAKASGIEKRKAMHALKKSRLATLAAAFPGIEFDLTAAGLAWTDGPAREEVNNVLGENIQGYRVLSPEFKATAAARAAAKVHAGRLAKRLAASKVRALRVAKGIERRRYAYCVHLGRRHQDSRQMSLPIDFPLWAKPPVYLSRVF